MKFVSVIMPSFLGHYPDRAKDAEKKFVRAVNSFLKNDHALKQLVIVSDGCEITNRICREKKWDRHVEIYLYEIDKQPLFSGEVRSRGLDVAEGAIIAYLDADDYILPNHLSNICSKIDELGLDWCYFNDRILTGPGQSQLRNAALFKGSCGTSNIAHVNNLPGLTWRGCDGYGHDFDFIQRLQQVSNRYDKIYGCGYIVGHIPKITDY